METGAEWDMEESGAGNIEVREEYWMHGGTERGDKRKGRCVATKIAEDVLEFEKATPYHFDESFNSVIKCLKLSSQKIKLLQNSYNSPSILQPSTLRPPVIRRLLGLVRKGNFLC